LIAQLAGTVLSVDASSLVVDVGGVGIHVLSTPGTLAGARAGQAIRVWTHLVVREESLTLFGFASKEERDAFVALQGVSGVGPRLALAMLAVHAPRTLAAAVATGDRGALERVPGIGAKVAARLLLELGGKLVLPDADGVVAAGDGRDQVVEALVGLGWNAKGARAAVDAVAHGPIEDSEVPTVLRAALQRLGGTHG
jgi:Holliday junction DNA helicase RuvA